MTSQKKFYLNPFTNNRDSYFQKNGSYSTIEFPSRIAILTIEKSADEKIQLFCLPIEWPHKWSHDMVVITHNVHFFHVNHAHLPVCHVIFIKRRYFLKTSSSSHFYSFWATIKCDTPTERILRGRLKEILKTHCCLLEILRKRRS